MVFSNKKAVNSHEKQKEGKDEKHVWEHPGIKEHPGKGLRTCMRTPKREIKNLYDIFCNKERSERRCVKISKKVYKGRTYIKAARKGVKEKVHCTRTAKKSSPVVIKNLSWKLMFLNFEEYLLIMWYVLHTVCIVLYMGSVTVWSVHV